MRRLRAALAFGWMAAAPLAAAVPRQFAHPDRVRYDGRCLTIDGEDVFIFSAEFDCFETPSAGWRRRFQEIRSAGFNTVATEAPAAGFAPSALRDWLRMAHGEFGLYSIVRTRRETLAAACRALAPEQITRRRPGARGTILVQLENGPDLKAGYRAMIAAGVETPIFACGAPQCRASDDPEIGQIFDAVSPERSAPHAALTQALAALEADQPDAPATLADGHSALQVEAALQEGAAVVNCAGPEAMSPAVLVLGRMLRRYGVELARSRALTIQAQPGSADIAIAVRRARAGATYVFLCNRSTRLARQGRAALWLDQEGIELGVNYALPPSAANIWRLPAGSTDTAKAEEITSLGK